MRSKTRSPAKVPRRWQQELAAQAKLRKRIAQAEKRYGQAKLDAQQALREGGKGWTTRVGDAELRAEKEWNTLRDLLLKLYTRKVIV